MPRPEIPNLTKIFYFENITWRGTQIIDVSVALANASRCFIGQRVPNLISFEISCAAVLELDIIL